MCVYVSFMVYERDHNFGSTHMFCLTLKPNIQYIISNVAFTFLKHPSYSVLGLLSSRCLPISFFFLQFPAYQHQIYLPKILVSAFHCHTQKLLKYP